MQPLSLVELAIFLDTLPRDRSYRRGRTSECFRNLIPRSGQRAVVGNRQLNTPAAWDPEFTLPRAMRCALVATFLAVFASHILLLSRFNKIKVLYSTAGRPDYYRDILY